MQKMLLKFKWGHCQRGPNYRCGRKKSAVLTGVSLCTRRCCTHGLLHYIYIFGVSCPLTEFCPVQSSLYVQVLRSPILAALLHGSPLQQRTSVTLCGMVQGMELRNCRKGRHLYSEGRPSRWASAHILVHYVLYNSYTFILVSPSAFFLSVTGATVLLTAFFSFVHLC